MTREEEIQRAAEEYSAYIDGNGEEFNNIELEAFKAGAEWADEHPVEKESVIMEMWVARDLLTTGDEAFLLLSDSKPFTTECRRSHEFIHWEASSPFQTCLFPECFPSVNFANSPHKVKVTIELED